MGVNSMTRANSPGAGGAACFTRAAFFRASWALMEGIVVMAQAFRSRYFMYIFPQKTQESRATSRRSKEGSNLWISSM